MSVEVGSGQLVEGSQKLEVGSGKYRTYPEYKDSGVEWLGSIPEHWSIKKLKYICKVQTGTKDTVNAVDDGNYPFFVRSQTVERINSVGADCEAVLTAGDGVGVGKVFHYYDGKFDYHQRVYMLNHFQQVFGRFVFYYLSNNFYKVALEGNAKSTVDSLRLPQFLNFEFALPELDIQSRIVAFLDHETAKIDTLLEEQQSLIRLLKEKRQAVISHAVTKGLNPDAAMKDSGVEWLGEVPEHWMTTKLKYQINSMDQGWSPQCDSRPADEEEYGVLKVGCVNGGTFNPVENKALPKELTPRLEYLLQKGQLLISRANTRELVGSAAVVDKEYSNLLICDKLYRITLQPEVHSDFIGLMLSTPAYREQIELGATGASSSMQNIGQSTIRELYVALPEPGEINDIIGHVALSTSKYDLLITEAQSAITYMQERRTALISAAVTGKIDVRDWQPAPVQKQHPAAEAAP